MGTLAIRTSLDVGSEELVKEIFKNLYTWTPRNILSEEDMLREGGNLENLFYISWDHGLGRPVILQTEPSEDKDCYSLEDFIEKFPESIYLGRCDIRIKESGEKLNIIGLAWDEFNSTTRLIGSSHKTYTRPELIITKLIEYPKTLERCFDLVGSRSDFYKTLSGVGSGFYGIVDNFHHLLICMKAYWNVWKKYYPSLSSKGVSKEGCILRGIINLPDENSMNQFYHNFGNMIYQVENDLRTLKLL